MVGLEGGGSSGSLITEKVCCFAIGALLRGFAGPEVAGAFVTIAGWTTALTVVFLGIGACCCCAMFCSKTLVISLPAGFFGAVPAGFFGRFSVCT